MRVRTLLAASLALTACSASTDLPDGGSGGGAASGGGSGTAGGGSALGGGTATGGGTGATGGGTSTGGGDAGVDAGSPFVDAGALGAFVAVGYGGRRLRSTDGLQWTNDVAWEANGGDDQDLLRAVAFGARHFEAVGWRITTSSDGTDWADGGPMNQWLGGLAYAKGIWVAAGGYGRRTWSTDGLTWHDAYDNDHRASRALAYDDASGRWVAVGDNGLLISTADAGTWTLANGDAGTSGFGAVGAGAGLTVAVSGHDVFVSHNGGLDWDAPVTLAANVDAVAHSGQQLVAIGSGHAFTSVDGAQWQDHPASGLGGALACHAGVCVAIASSRAFRSADDGVTWSSAGLDGGAPQGINAIGWGSW